MNERDLKRIVSEINLRMGAMDPSKPLLNSVSFAQLKALELFNLRSFWVIYPEASRALWKWVEQKPSKKWTSLIDALGESGMKKLCAQAGNPRPGESAYDYWINVDRIEKSPPCLAQWMEDIVRIEPGKNLEAQTRQQTRLLDLMMKNLPPEWLFQTLGVENSFYQFRISGFRKGEEEIADQEIVSDSVGRYNSDYGFGPLTMLANDTEISNYEIFAQSLSEGN
jgi:hypothetical protein